MVSVVSEFRILVIDDEDSVRESLGAFLEDHDFRVKCAVSAEEAFEMLQHDHFDLVVVDMRLPGESGDAFILKAAELFSDLRFVIHTGSVEFQLSEELLARGIEARDVYLKPLHDLSLLVDGIKTLLNDRR